MSHYLSGWNSKKNEIKKPSHIHMQLHMYLMNVYITVLPCEDNVVVIIPIGFVKNAICNVVQVVAEWRIILLLG